MNRTLFFLLSLLSLSANADIFTKLKTEVEKKSVSGIPAFIGDYASVDSALTMANIYKLPPCSAKTCAFDFSSNSKGRKENELFTCSLPANLKINFANNDKGYIFLESPSEIKMKTLKCSLRLEMKNKNTLKVTEIDCPQTKIGDCSKSLMLGEFRRMGRPSFDCGVLTPYLELSVARRTICHNLELSRTDKELDDLYERVRSKDEGRQAETQYMRKRESCGASVPCLTETYQKWRQHLQGLEAP